MAIIAAFNSPEDVEVIGLTTVFGNVPTPMATANALRLVHIAGLSPQIPVYEGSHTSLCGVTKERIADFVHGADGFGNTNQPSLPHPSAPTPSPGSAAEFIVRAANQYPSQVTILALASLTNLALALQLDPLLSTKLKNVVVLGGAFFTSGNVNPAAEANIFGDPDAANIVFSRFHSSNCYVLGLDVTHKCRMSTGDIEDIKGRGKHGTFLHSITQFYLQYHRTMYGMEAVFVHDAAALAAVIAPELFEWRDGKVVVVTEGPNKGKTVMDECKREWVGFNAWTALPKIKVALDVKADALVQWVLDRMCR